MQHSPLRLPPYRFMGIDEGTVIDGDSIYSYVFEDYSWEGRPIRASDLYHVPVFWTPHTLATALGITIEEVADAALVLPPRLLDPGYTLTRVPKMFFSDAGDPSEFNTISEACDARGVWGWSTRIGESTRLNTLPTTDLVRFGFPHDDYAVPDTGTYVPRMASRKFLGGEMLVVRAFSFGVGDYNSGTVTRDAEIEGTRGSLDQYAGFFDQVRVVKLLDDDNPTYIQGYENVVAGYPTQRVPYEGAGPHLSMRIRHFATIAEIENDRALYTIQEATSFFGL